MQSPALRLLLGVSVAVILTLAKPLASDKLAVQYWGFASDRAALDLFGYSVAIDGDTALIGAPLDDHSTGADRGSVYVFTRVGERWAEQAKIDTPDAPIEFDRDRFGTSVALHGDTAVVGAPGRDGDTGAAYVFVRTADGTWLLQQKLVARGLSAFDGFGVSVGIEGDLAIVGADFDSTDAVVGHGAAYVFNRTGGVWGLQAKLLASDGAAFDVFGTSVALSNGRAVVGAPGKRSESGAAYVFASSEAGWTQQAKLVAPDGALGHQFGNSVALDGDTALVGAPRSGPVELPQTGSAYVFSADASSWTHQAKLTADRPAIADLFGATVALAGDTALVGAPLRDGAFRDEGRAFVFSRADSSWTLSHELNGKLAERDNFGKAVAFDGGSVLVGAEFEDSDVRDSGAIWVFVAVRDDDEDGVVNDADNCPIVPNKAQENHDRDDFGDACDRDDDNDARADEVDSCPAGETGWTADLTTDRDADGCRDAGEDVDDDNDGVLDGADNCPLFSNTDQANADRDRAGDACDPDDDNDAVVDGADNCPLIANASQRNRDGDPFGDACDEDDDNDGRGDATDSCPAGDTGWTPDVTNDHDGDACRDATEDLDDDNDGIADDADSCAAGDTAWTSNGATDTDADGCRDAGEDADDDNDTVEDAADNCPVTANSTQGDADLDALGDVCDDDDDNDTAPDATDNCPLIANTGQSDTDGDGAGNACDADDDGDSLLDEVDNCPLIVNLDQFDADDDDIGAACDTNDHDHDNDGVVDDDDNCLAVANPGQDDADADNAGDACDLANAFTGLVAAWGFEEGAGLSVLDLSGNNNNGTISGAVWDAGRFGSALLFDGTDDLVTVPNSASLTLTNKLTIEAWVRPSTVSVRSSILMKEGAGNLSYALYAADPMRSNLSLVSGRNTRRVQGDRLVAGVWTHLAATFDGTTVRLYINGVRVQQKKDAGPITTTTGALRIGGNGVWGEFFAGLLDEVRVYNRVLTMEQIQIDMNRPVATDSTPQP